MLRSRLAVTSSGAADLVFLRYLTKHKQRSILVYSSTTTSHRHYQYQALSTNSSISRNYHQLLRTNLSTMAATEVNTAADKFAKLPELAKPRHYDLKLKPDLVKFVFHGSETIKLEITQATNVLKLYAQDIEIKHAALKLKDGSELDNLKVQYDKKWSTIEIELGKTVQPGEATLQLDFVGNLNDKMHGFYRSCYKTADGTEKYLAATQFESTYARLCFPCWDEPLYKATFDVTLEVDEKHTALSNMNIIDETAKDGLKTIKYATTPLMSSYLVAFAVGEFEYIESKTNNGIIVRVYSVPGKKDQAKFGLEVATRAIEWYNDWFGIVYPLPKCDLIAIPDFAMGAMENWGLVTYREVALLVDPAKSSTRHKSRIALVIAHELAHMWFGNLVTMKWWTDLWLKEGFATFMEYLFVGAIYPEYKIWLHFVNDELASGFSLDALRSSHPIEVSIDNPNELDEIYDSITYAKSCSVNRMLCSYLGEEKFKEGLRIYLNKFKYSNAQTTDLWDALSKASNVDVNSLMSPWTKQMGFPVVTVSEEEKDDNKRILKLTQKRFIADGTEDMAKPLWQVPINISSEANPNDVVHKILLKQTEQTKETITGIPANQWIKLNAGTTGFYRVEYSNEMLQALLPAVRNKSLPVVDRFGLANDLFALVESGRVSAAQFLSLVSASTEEDEYTVRATLDAGIGALSNVLSRAEDKTLKSRFDAFVIKCLEPIANKLGWDPCTTDDSQTGMLRAVVLGRLGKAGHQPTLDTAVVKFREHFEKKVELYPDLRQMIYAMIGRHGGAEGYEQLKTLYETSGFGEVERHCLLGMSQSLDGQVQKNAFHYALNEGKVRSQDLPMLFYGAAMTRSGQDFVWPYFKDNFTALIDKFGSANHSLFQHILKISADAQCSESIAKDVENFFVDKDCARTLDRPIRQTVESIRINCGLLKSNAVPIADWLTKAGF